MEKEFETMLRISKIPSFLRGILDRFKETFSSEKEYQVDLYVVNLGKRFSLNNYRIIISMECTTDETRNLIIKHLSNDVL